MEEGETTHERVEAFAARHFRYWFYIGFSSSCATQESGDVFDFSSSRKKKASADAELVSCSFRKYKGARAGDVYVWPEGPRYRSANQVLPRPDIN